MAVSRTLLSLLFPLFLLFVIPEVYADICAPPNKDVKVLKAQRFWQFEVSHKDFPGCKPFYPSGVKNGSSTCIFYFSICTPVPDFCPENSGICLANKVDFSGSPAGNKTLYTQPINIGSFKEGKNHFKAEPTYFDVIFDFGEEIVNSSKSLLPVTKIRFTCTENATWETSKDGKVPQLAHVHVDYTIVTETTVMYNIELEYKGACPGGGGGGSSEEPSKPLSVGSILLILFFPGIFLYCVVGALINRGAGKTGKEMIPNSKFWTELPGLISDGFSFVIAKITCSQMSTSREPYDRM